MLGNVSVLILFVATLCGCAAMQQAQQAKTNEFQQTIPKCFTDKECERKWAAAQSWVVTHAAWKIQNVTSGYIETYNPAQSSPGIAVRVVKEPIENNGYRFVVTVWCNNIFGCQPNAWDAALHFNRTINAITTSQ